MVTPKVVCKTTKDQIARGGQLVFIIPKKEFWGEEDQYQHKTCSNSDGYCGHTSPADDDDDDDDNDNVSTDLIMLIMMVLMIFGLKVVGGGVGCLSSCVPPHF